ncbi:hypothetical protein Q9L58_000802 [Maublancomyces gigas]|uniref:Tubulin-specific chaperone A n=1 Tax=Discina gigas TaxID=1032678 RepID=A0ABR3GXD6_9PEZI
MPPPSALSIKTSSVTRLIKEEALYHKEVVAQEKVIAKLEKEGGDEYELRQQRKVLDETIVMAPAVRKRLATALEQLEMALENVAETEIPEAKEKATKAFQDGQAVLAVHADAK